MDGFKYLVTLLRQFMSASFGGFDTSGVSFTPRTFIKTDGFQTATTRSPIIGAFAEGGGLGSYLESRAATFRNFVTSTTRDLIDGAKSFAVTCAMIILRRVRFTTFRDQAAAA